MNIYRRPEITEELIDFIRRQIMENPDMGRTKLSVMLCEIWNWRDSHGRTKDMSCRDMLTSLDKAGKIVLPAPRCILRRPGDSKGVKHFDHDETPVTGKLRDFQPLRVENISSKDDFLQFKSYIDQYHYLGFERCISESMAYMIYSCDNKPLASLQFGSAAWSCRERDSFIGWGKDERRHNLSLITNNSRFLIYPWVNIPHLASHILSLIARRISADWYQKYGHQLCVLETFVEVDRFKGTCYKAANWINVGRTTGRGRNGGHNHAILPLKDIYVYPLTKDFQSILCTQETEVGTWR